jgi:hypothetical protein
MCINVNEFRRILEAKRGELLLPDVGDRDEILIENAAEEFDRVQQQLNREVAIRKLDQQSKQLKSVETALARIDDGTMACVCAVKNKFPTSDSRPFRGQAIALPVRRNLIGSGRPSKSKMTITRLN